MTRNLTWLNQLTFLQRAVRQKINSLDVVCHKSHVFLLTKKNGKTRGSIRKEDVFKDYSGQTELLRE